MKVMKMKDGQVLVDVRKRARTLLVALVLSVAASRNRPKKRLKQQR
jgi:hypothetical protein